MARDRTAPILFFTLLALYLAVAGGRLYVNDAYVKLAVARSLTDRCALDVPPHGKLTVFSPADGKTYAKFGILHSLLWTPATFLGGALVRAGAIPESQRVLFEGTLASLLSPVATALAVLLFYFWARAVYGRREGALAAALLLGLATFFWPYAKRSWTETPQTAFLVGAALLLHAPGRSAGRGRLFAGGLLLGGATALRITGVVLVPLFSLLLIPSPWNTKRWIERCAAALLGFLAAVIPLVVGLNWIRFGDPISLFAWRSGGFTTPFLTGLAGLLVSPGESIFLYAPVTIAGAAALVLHRRRAPRLHLFCGAVVVALILLYAPWWFHAYTWGPRFLLPALPFLLLPLASPLVGRSRRWRRLIVVLVLITAFVQVPGLLFHLGGLPQMEAPLVRHGIHPPDRPLSRGEIWFHPLRNRLVAHWIVFGETVAGKPPTDSLDLWPLTLRNLFGIPLRITLPAQLFLLLAGTTGAAVLVRRASGWGKEENGDQGRGSV
ncbi:MAG: glycosyltransferase family 39 protein [Candidatus Eisenbacteria bacterium]|nr:glycosyltransferase family 39 protein [Candidatus Eisenbacteria bacterium]